MEHQTNGYTLEDFVGEMTAIVEQNKSDDELVVDAERLVGKLVQSDSWLPPAKRKPSNDSYARHSLYCDPKDRFEVIALVWKPGQRTGLHDHDGTWGAEGVVAGQIKAENFIQLEEISSNVVKLKHSNTIVISQQSTGKLLPPADCHILEAVGDQTAITIHVYGKQLRKFRVFSPLAEEGIYLAEEKQVEYTPKK
ncbi:cysteine dioxygenase [Scopulibacillus cellulosilyticus]|uniref:Cysteine dioxygenase n=1 Tax=Scopulibacillus cellulosilyticus TaxID=2665665 RepID=A0ABW2Q2P5_9BACL